MYQQSNVLLAVFCILPWTASASPYHSSRKHPKYSNETSPWPNYLCGDGEKPVMTPHAANFDESDGTIAINASVPIPYEGLAFKNFVVHSAAEVHIIVPATPPNYLFGGSGLAISTSYPNSSVQAFNLKQLSYTCGSMASTDPCNITFTGRYTAKEADRRGNTSVSTTETFSPVFSSGGLSMETVLFAASGDWDGLRSVDIDASFNGPTTPGLAALVSMDQVLYDTVACPGITT